MARAALAGLVYFAIVFAIGFVLGGIRVLLVAPVLGALGAVLVELPVILLACWLAAGWLVRWLNPKSASATLNMGAVAFMCLMIAEFSLAALAFDRSLTDQIRHWATLEGALGLGGQILFAILPWVQGRRTAAVRSR